MTYTRQFVVVVVVVVVVSSSSNGSSSSRSPLLVNQYLLRSVLTTNF